MSDLIRRRDATEKTRKKYVNKEFSWKDGISCIHMIRSHALNMGHKPPKLPRIRSAIGAKRALKQNDWASVSEMMDAHFARIAPAQMMLGDVAALPSEDGFGALIICAGHKMLGYHDADLSGLKNIVVDEFDGAWRL